MDNVVSRIENASPIVKACIHSVIINRAKHPVYIISKYNIEKYIYLPYHIKEKFNNRTFSVTHFSDIVRFALLSRYGGYWIDSTFFLNTPLIKLNSTYFTLKLKYCWIKGHPFIKCLFSGNFMAVCKNSFIATYCYMAFLQYWKKYNSLIDYQLIDYIIHIAYINIKEFTQKINALPFIECNIFLLAENFNSSYNKSHFLCSYNKLSYKRAVQSSNSNGMTNYGYLIENYKLGFKHIGKKLILNI